MSNFAVNCFDMTAHTAIFYTLVAAYVLLVAWLVVAVLSESRNPLKTIAWVMALILFPVGGIVLYFFFGRSLRGTRMISRRNRKRLMAASWAPGAPAKLPGKMTSETRKLVRLASVVSDTPYSDNNAVTIYQDGKSHFKALFNDLANARHSINLQYYIIANDKLGRRLRDLLIEKAKQGVKVRVIYDYIGSFDARRRNFFMTMKEHGIEVHAFFKINFASKLSRVNWRNHRKVVVIDDEVGYIGGMNIADRYVDGGKQFALWRDTMVRITGPGVAALKYNFAVDWKFMGQSLLSDDPHGPADHAASLTEGVGVQFVTSGPTERWQNMSLLIQKAIGVAKKRIWIQTPYFLPSDSLLSSLQAAALAGVDVRVMMPRRCDSALLTYASRSFVEECLLAGIKVLFFLPGMHHAKVLIVDDEFSTIGSTNFDFRSFEHNFEENILLYSPQTNRQLAKQFLRDASHSQRVTMSEWSRRSRSSRIKESLSRLLSPVL